MDSVALCGRRLSTAGLLAVLGMLYPRSYMLFLSLMFLDIFSHWCACRPAVALGSAFPADNGAMRCVCKGMAIRDSLPLRFNAITIRAGFRCIPRLFRAVKPTRCGGMLMATQHCRRASGCLQLRIIGQWQFHKSAGPVYLLAGICWLQDVNSRSWLVRTYYRNRMFMGICCISCEVLYLSVSTAAAARLVKARRLQCV